MKLNEYELSGYDVFVNVSSRFETQDISGETSSTSTANKGIKAKVIDVSLSLAFTESESLNELYKIAEAVDDNGDFIIYTITDDTVNAANIRQATFFGRLNVREARRTRAWQIRFQLREHLSVPEKKEIRQNASLTEETTSVSTTEGDQPETSNLTGFEKVLKVIDDSLA